MKRINDDLMFAAIVAMCGFGLGAIFTVVALREGWVSL